MAARNPNYEARLVTGTLARLTTGNHKNFTNSSFSAQVGDAYHSPTGRSWLQVAPCRLGPPSPWMIADASACDFRHRSSAESSEFRLGVIAIHRREWPRIRAETRQDSRGGKFPVHNGSGPERLSGGSRPRRSEARRRPSTRQSALIGPIARVVPLCNDSRRCT